MNVVVAERADGEAIRALHVETWAATYRDSLPEPFYSERLQAHRARDWAELLRHAEVLIARDGEGVAGMCQYGAADDGDDDPQRVGHIYRLYVHPRHQRAGLGTALLTEATRRLHARRMEAVTLWVLESDERARRFYERLGWRPDGERRFNGAPDVRYWLPLGPGRGVNAPRPSASTR